MYRYISIGDLVANALIELMKQDTTARRISLQALFDYGAEIAMLLTQPGQNVILFLSREATREYVDDYTDFFSIQEYDGIEYIELRDGVAVEELRRQFRKNLTVDVAKAMREKGPLKALEIST